MSLVGEKDVVQLHLFFHLFRPVKHYEYTNIQNIEIFEAYRLIRITYIQKNCVLD